MTGLILKRAPIGWNQDDYDVVEGGVVVGRIFKVPIAPHDRLWMWASSRNGHMRCAAHGCEATREDAMTAFAKSWRPRPRSPSHGGARASAMRQLASRER